jgi:predicted transport protein
MADADAGIATQIRNIERDYGKPMSDWVEIVNSSGLTKHTEIVSMLKSEHGMRHGAAHRTALVARTALQPPATNATEAVDLLYSGKRSALRPLHDRLVDEVNRLGDDIELAPKKGYISIRSRKQFAMIQPSTTNRIDLGLVLKEHPVTARLESATSFNGLFTHRVRIATTEDIDVELLQWLADAHRSAR